MIEILFSETLIVYKAKNVPRQYEGLKRKSKVFAKISE